MTVPPELGRMRARKGGDAYHINRPVAIYRRYKKPIESAIVDLRQSSGPARRGFEQSEHGFSMPFGKGPV